jgi:hypothetical protein
LIFFSNLLHIASRDRLIRFMRILNIEERLTFVATLEWMLHCVLSNEDSLIDKDVGACCIVRIIGGAEGKREAITIGQGLDLVVQFLRQFPHFYGNFSNLQNYSRIRNYH